MISTAYVVNDLQFPYHDPALWEVCIQIARDNDVDHLVLNGDMLDFPQLGQYRKNPYVLEQASLDVDRFWERVVDPLLGGNPQISTRSFLAGNHEQRYERYVVDNAPAIMVEGLRKFLRLDDTWDYHPYERASGLYLAPDLLVTHGWLVRSSSGATAKAHALDMGGISVLLGHTHRVGVYAKTTPAGTQWAYECGHMSKDPPAASPGLQDWQQTAGTLVHMWQGGWSVELLPVWGNTVMAGGRHYSLN